MKNFIRAVVMHVKTRLPGQIDHDSPFGARFSDGIQSSIESLHASFEIGEGAVFFHVDRRGKNKRRVFGHEIVVRPDKKAPLEFIESSFCPLTLQKVLAKNNDALDFSFFTADKKISRGLAVISKADLLRAFGIGVFVRAN